MENYNSHEKRRGVAIICFMGIDGSGKTTQADLIEQFLLKSMNKKIKRIYFFSSKREVAGGMQSQSFISNFIENLNKQGQNPILNYFKVNLRVAGTILDSWLSYHNNSLNREASVILYDRYYYDSLVAVAIKHYSMRHFILCMSKLIPKPNIIILFEISAKESVRRKPEHAIDEAMDISTLYAQFKRLLPLKTVNAELDVRQIEEQIKTMCVETNEL